MKITFYGSRGTASFSCKDNAHFGGNTMCVRVDLNEHMIILDCGSGIFELGKELSENKGVPLKFDILLGHLHIDHVIGLSVFEPIFKDNDIRIFTKSRDNTSLEAQIFGIFKPPYWPVELGSMNKARLMEINVGIPFMLNAKVKVTPFSAEHPNETTVFRIDGEKSLVYLMDYEVDRSPEKYSALVDFCKNADVIIFDASYLPEDYPRKQGFGHSTYEDGLLLLEDSSCGQIIFGHFSLEYTDDTLKRLSKKLEKYNKNCLVARDGMIVEI